MLQDGAMDLYDQRISEVVLRARFGLSPAEAQIALAVAGGATVRAVAASRGASVLTVRSQLKAIFRKVGVKSQVQLVSLVLR
jgi:DNA-binding CsgD family transcriptional regulator